MDRGFLFGDGAYEMIPVYSRQPFRLEEHLGRLQRTLDGIHLDNPLSLPEWEAVIRRVVAENEPEDQSIYLQVTRGAAPERNHAFPTDVAPTVFVMTSPLVPPTAFQLATGVPCVSAVDFRWHRCDLKTVSLLANCLLKQQAVDAGCAETLLFRDGFLTEGSASNIFVVKDGVLLAPPRNHLMLTGITYDVVLELAARHGQPVEVRDILEEEVRAADELWITSSSKEVLPITTLDGKPVGSGRPGPLGRAMHDWYQAFKHSVMRSSAS